MNPSASGQPQHVPILSVKGVTKRYVAGGSPVPALRGVDLEIDDPGFYAIMGQSGSGKTTLLHLLAALDRPDEGEIHIAGTPVHTMDERQATHFRRRRIGIVFQQFNLIASLTAQENVELPGMLAGEPLDAMRARSTELLERLGLGNRLHHRPDALSGGEQQRVAIARALLFAPPVLYADEPTGNLDSASSRKLWGLLGEIAAERSMLVVMVTHEPAAAANCRRIFVIRDGRVFTHIDTEGLDAAGVAARYQQCIREA
jgi:putative ABC transport system ATP-binding protein